MVFIVLLKEVLIYPTMRKINVKIKKFMNKILFLKKIVVILCQINKICNWLVIVSIDQF